MSLPSSDIRGARATRALIDLDAIDGNVRALRAALPGSTRLMAVVKADAYGHGATWVARAALDAGAALLGVATVGEGQILRAHGIDASIVILGSLDAAEADAACDAGLEITVAGERLLESVQRTARRALASLPVPVHLKIDTGLRRHGATAAEAVGLACRIAADPYLRFASIFTHFASADEPAEPFTTRQLHEFEHAIVAIRDSGVSLPALHAANSAGVLTGRGTDFAIARPGIALYGIPPSTQVPLLPGMRPAITLQSRITRLIDIAPGDTVGYNRTYRASSPARAALIPIGYADGYRRALSGRGWVGIGGRRGSVLGRVSMDQIVVAIPEGTDAAVGDEVIIMGGNRATAAPSIAEMADLMDTNAYEVVVGIRSRVPRLFLRGGEIVGMRATSDFAGAPQPAAGRGST